MKINLWMPNMLNIIIVPNVCGYGTYIALPICIHVSKLLCTLAFCYKSWVLFMNRKWVSTFPVLASQLMRFKGMQWWWQSFIFINILIISEFSFLILQPWARGDYLIKSPTLDPGLLKSECLSTMQIPTML